MPFMVIDSAIGMLIAASVALLFASAGVHKLRDLRRFDETFAAYELMPALAHRRISRMVPILEMAAAVRLLVDGWRRTPAYWASCCCWGTPPPSPSIFGVGAAISRAAAAAPMSVGPFRRGWYGEIS